MGPSPVQTPLTDPRVWNRIDFQSDKIFKTQPINQQGTTNNSNGKFHLLQRKTNFPTTTTKKNERREARLKLIPGEISSIKFPRSSFPVAHAGLETRSCNRSQRAGGGWSVWAGGVTSDRLGVARSWCLRVGRLRSDRGKFVRCFLYIDISV